MKRPKAKKLNLHLCFYGIGFLRGLYIFIINQQIKVRIHAFSVDVQEHVNKSAYRSLLYIDIILFVKTIYDLNRFSSRISGYPAIPISGEWNRIYGRIPDMKRPDIRYNPTYPLVLTPSILKKRIFFIREAFDKVECFYNTIYS